MAARGVEIWAGLSHGACRLGETDLLVGEDALEDGMDVEDGHGPRRMMAVGGGDPFWECWAAVARARCPGSRRGRGEYTCIFARRWIKYLMDCNIRIFAAARVRYIKNSLPQTAMPLL